MPFQKGQKPYRHRKPAHPEQTSIMTPIADYSTKIQVMLRVDRDKHQALREKLKFDNMKRQTVWDRFVDLYLENNYQLMKMLEPCRKQKRGQAVSTKELKKIEKQLELESPLQDLVIKDDPFNQD